MKRKNMMLLAIVVLLPMIFGVSKCQITSDQGVEAAVRLSAYNLGYYVGKSKTTSDDQAIKDAYILAREGRLDPATVTSALVKLKMDNPQLAGNAVIVLGMMGASIQNGAVTSLVDIRPELWNAARDAYATGQLLGSSEQTKRDLPTREWIKN